MIDDDTTDAPGIASNIVDTSLSQAKQNALVYLTQLQGLSGSAYQQALFPHDTSDFSSYAARSMSSCGLTVMATWRAAGVRLPLLDEPYADHVGEAIAGLVKAAKEATAWRPISPEVWPDFSVGDAILIGSNDDPSFGGVEHIFTVVAVDDLGDGKRMITSIDGGQPGIEERKRLLLFKGQIPWMCSADSPYSPQGPRWGRRMVGSIDLDAVAAMFGG